MSVPTTSRPVALDDVIEDPGPLREAVRTSGPHRNQARYVPAGLAASFASGHPLLGSSGTGASPVFRSDWFRWGDPTPGAHDLTTHGRLVNAARQTFDDASEVLLTQIHINLTVPGPQPDHGHVDVPVLRGLDRRNAPGWLLLALARSGVADEWWISTATAVVWLQSAAGGGFTWWPDGPAAEPVRIEDVWNRAVVMDADRTLHRAEPLLTVRRSELAVGRDTVLDAAPEGSGWVLRHPDGSSDALADDEVRISISWKAAVFEHRADLEAYERGDDALSLDGAVVLLADEIRRRGGGTDVRDATGVGDPSFVGLVERLIPRPRPTDDSGNAA